MKIAFNTLVLVLGVMLGIVILLPFVVLHLVMRWTGSLCLVFCHYFTQPVLDAAEKWRERELAKRRKT